MANTEKQGAMVLHEEGMTAPTLAPSPTSGPSLFVVLKQVHPGDVLKDKGSLLAISEANSIMKSAASTAATGLHSTSSMSLSDATTHVENMPADARYKGITVTLDNNSMWNEFSRCRTEMILTKQGRRMFPYCRFRLSGMEPFQSYLLAMDIVPVDNHRYKWSGKGWETNAKADPHVSRLFVHPESPATGLHWMQYPVSFYRLKLCNNTLDQEGHIILHSMHRYLPRLHIIPADKDSEDIRIDRPEVITLSFSQTEFFAVTAYQNLSITQLKIDYNPFAKGFREDAVNARSTKAKNGVLGEETEKELKLSKESTTLNNLKTLFMKRNAAAKVNKDQNVPSPTNGEKKVVNGDAPVEDGEKSAKKRPLSGAFSDFLKGAHVKVKRLSLDNIEKNCVLLQSNTGGTSGKQAVEAISSKLETVMEDIHKCNNTDTTSKKELIKLDEIKMVIDEHKDNKITSLSSDKKGQISDEKKMENISSPDTEAEPEGKTKKTLPHKRPEPVPLPLLAQFLKRRKFQSKSNTPAPEEAPCLAVDCKPQLTSESSPALISSTILANTQIDSQPPLTSSSQTVISSSTEDASNMTSTSTASLSSPSLTTDPLIQEEEEEEEPPLRFSPSPSDSESLLSPNNSSTTKSNLDPSFDSVLDVFSNAENVSVQGFVNTLMSQSDFSSVFTCNVLDDTDSPTTPAVKTNVVIDHTVTISPNSAFDVPSNKNNEILPNLELSSLPQVEIESFSDCLLENSNGLCSDLFTEEVLDTNDESLSLPLDGPSSPTFSIPSPVLSSPDPFPPDLFSDRPLPPRKALDSCPERLLDCTGISSSDIFTLLCDIPAAPINHLDSFQGRICNGPLDSVSSSLSRSGLFNRSIDLISQKTSNKQVPVKDIQSTVNCVSNETAPSDHSVPEPTKQSTNGSTLKKSDKKLKKVGKLKHGDDDEVFEGPVPAPMQPSLEDVDGQLFASFMSKTALEIHLGDDAKTEVAQKTLETSDSDNRGSIEEKIKVLEKNLLHDLKLMKHRQVIHPVLQEVGLKLHLLDVNLPIDLQYLGVQVPIPVLLPEESPESSQVQFVSRTGKTTDVTKIKGWRDKFAGSGSQSEGVPSVETGQNNLSAFCSDMLDEYLASEGKLIDERAANLSQTDTTTVAYQLPTKSTSYVRTLDSVLKKQVPPALSSSSKHSSSTSSKSKPMFKSKLGNTPKKNLKSAKGNQVLSTTKPTIPVSGGDKLMSLNKVQQSKRLERNNIRKASKSLSTEKVLAEIPAVVAFDKTPRLEESGSTAACSTGGRSPGLPKTLVKLMDVEDGAVWEGKRRTCITEERAAIALTALFTAESATKANPDAMRIIKRRAPPCLNVFCRLGCLCASLLHQRRHHHCGKPECMLGCSCLRRKVIALKRPKEEDSITKEPEPQGLSEDNKTKWKKNKNRKTYVLTDPEAAPEPAKRVNTLWDSKSDESDSEIFCPPPPRVTPAQLLSKDLQHDLERFFSPPKPKRVGERNLNMMEESSDMENHLTCARVRPFRPCRNKQKKPVDQQHIPQIPKQDIEEGELVPLNLSGPIKRLEIISECSWSSTDSRNDVMGVVCKNMAQDRLKNPFWVGKYYIQQVSKTVQETEEGSVHTYKVKISEPVEKKKEVKNVSQNDVQTESIQPVEKIEVKGLPFLARCSSAGLLKAEKKAPNAPGQIMVNGKPYPQAKLELGKMGALHPANRLAAYITGRICPVGQSVATYATTSTTAKASTTVPVTNVAAVTSVTSTCASTIPSPIKTAVTNPPAGQVFTQFVVNHINSQNQASTSAPHLQSTPPKIVIPTSLLMVSREAGVPGVALSSLKTDLPTQVSKAAVSTGSISFPNVSNIQAPTITILNKPPSLPLGGTNVTPSPSSGSPTSGKKTVLITVVSRKSGITSSGPPVEKPVTHNRPQQTAGQKMTLQVVKTADGNTLYRNPSGQLIRLVPLSQIKSMMPNSLPKGPTTLFRLPAPNVVSPNKPQSGGTTTVTPSSSTSQTQPKYTYTVPAPGFLSGKPGTLTTSKSVSFNSLPSTIKVTPTFLGQSGTCTLRIFPPNTLKDTASSTPTSSASLSQGGFTLLKPSTSTLQNQDSTKSETIASVSSGSTEGPVSQVQRKQGRAHDSKTSESTAVNTSQISSSIATSPKPTRSSSFSFSHRELGELEGSDLAANPYEKEGECDTDQQEEGNGSDGSELTDDSDLYSEDDQDDTYSDSDNDELGPVEDDDEDELGSEMKDPAEVVVDIESFEESVEKIKIALLKESAKKKNLLRRQQQKTDDQKIKRVHNERVRRCTLRERFLKLQLTLKKSLKNISKNRILTLAKEEIVSLVQQESRLVTNSQKLRIERERYLQKLSMMSVAKFFRFTDKSEESISQKLKEIVAKQKTLESQNEARAKTSKIKQTKSKHFSKSTNRSSNPKSSGLQKEKDVVSELAQSPSKPIDLSLKKQRSLDKPESIKEDSTSKLKELESNRSTPTSPVKDKSSVSSPFQPIASSIHSKYAPVTIPITRERPNILSSSQTTPASPVKEPLVTNKVIPLMTLQPIGITALGPQQSTTPGVASVSISVAAMPQPLGVEKPLPMLQPQFTQISDSPVKINTQVEPINLSNVSNVISLVPPLKNLVVPQQVVLEKTVTTPAVQAQTISIQSHLEEREAVDGIPKEAPKHSTGGDVLTTSVTSRNQDGLDKNGQENSNDADDENLMSLLDELVLLSQQLSNDSPEPTNEDQSDVVPNKESSQSDHQEDTERDDDRELSPLFLTLDEDLMSPESSKDEMDDIPPKVDDLVKVIFGSDSPTTSSESGIATSTDAPSPQPPTGSVTGDPLTPPPLLHMKATCGAVSSHPASEGANVTWRPMPKLVPLGLKDAVPNKVNGSSVLKSDSKAEDV
ncbi:MAX gene-associated protein [Triplophysa tibetana]|uniref:MAX gene-associated protein n=1 Tax=Triplophysa tibetana TaxID=1572043 RepID=A0A5A9NN65_9TELE|nr:MAX gene-associated protein [Triplophysa tibetana]